MTHAGGGDAWADETTFHPVGEEGVAAAAISAARAMEATIEQSGLDWLVSRGGLFYGPGTGFDDDWFARARDAKLRMPEDGNGYVSLVHIADMAAATVAAIGRWPSRQALIVADDQPAPWRDVLTYVCAARERWLVSCSNAWEPSTIPAPDQARNRDRIRQTGRRHPTGNSQECAEAGRPEGALISAIPRRVGEGPEGLWRLRSRPPRLHRCR
jgi:nucleoside-diphosphate-sugar epimerase